VIYAGIFSDFFDKLDEWSAERWFLLLIFVIAFLDSVIPIVPSELCVIAGGVAVSTGSADYNLWMVIGAGALGAFLGDNTAYSIGKLFSGPLERRAARKEKFRSRLQWAHEQIQIRGGPLLITARFIPGGRSILTISSGITRQRRRWFARWVAIAAVIWATYAAGLAYIVGQPFEDNHTAAFLVAFAVALSANVLIEIIRHVRKKRKERRERQMAGEATAA